MISNRTDKVSHMYGAINHGMILKHISPHHTQNFWVELQDVLYLLWKNIPKYHAVGTARIYRWFFMTQKHIEQTNGQNDNGNRYEKNKKPR